MTLNTLYRHMSIVSQGCPERQKVWKVKWPLGRPNLTTNFDNTFLKRLSVMLLKPSGVLTWNKGSCGPGEYRDIAEMRAVTGHNGEGYSLGRVMVWVRSLVCMFFYHLITNLDFLEIFTSAWVRCLEGSKCERD